MKVWIESEAQWHCTCCRVERFPSLLGYCDVFSPLILLLGTSDAAYVSVDVMNVVYSHQPGFHPQLCDT